MISNILYFTVSGCKNEVTIKNSVELGSLKEYNEHENEAISGKKPESCS